MDLCAIGDVVGGDPTLASDAEPSIAPRKQTPSRLSLDKSIKT